MQPGSIIVLCVFYGLLVLLTVSSLHRLLLAIAARRIQRSRKQLTADPVLDEWPAVVVQLPLYNEPKVAARIIKACAALDYPEDKFTVQVLDDSTGSNRLPVDEAVRHAKDNGAPIELIRRTKREGYKAGALQVGLERSSAPFIAVLDADFIPPQDFLKRMIPAFEDETGMVQARWAYTNPLQNLLTRAQRVLLNGHFCIEQRSRSAKDLYFNFNGTAGIWRREAIVEAGGWQFDTLTEDFDLSYRAQLEGWAFTYREDIEVPSELPGQLSAFRSQQHRWSKGGTQTFRKLIGRVLTAKSGARKKLEAVFHLAANLNYVWMLGAAILMPFAVHLHPRAPQWLLQPLDALLIGTTVISMTTFYGIASFDRSGLSRRRMLTDIGLALLVDIGIALEKGRGAIEAIIGKSSAFVRTPKAGHVSQPPNAIGDGRDGTEVALHRPASSSSYEASVPANAALAGVQRTEERTAGEARWTSTLAALTSNWLGEALLAVWLGYGAWSVFQSFAVSPLGSFFLVLFALAFGLIATTGFFETVRTMVGAKEHILSPNAQHPSDARGGTPSVSASVVRFRHDETQTPVAAHTRTADDSSAKEISGT